ncbi:MAG: galactitol-1-phosphate 5-dehydrogenase [Lachnospiraceae bacterium]|nr:galactitol-1-phosphate 5-dehydrogenase [Lachnospiraceae bacterium]
MKALVLKEYNKFSYEDVPMPEVKDDEVLIKVMAASICGSDVHGMDGSTGRRVPPIIMGHEASGIVYGLGKDVKGFEIGDRVAVQSLLQCGKCEACMEGKYNLCENRLVLGVSCDELYKNGTYAEYATVRAIAVHKLPEGLDFIKASMVEPLSIAYHAVSLIDIDIKKPVLVLGTGTIGIFAVQVLNAMGCENIIAADRNDNKLEIAKKSGAKETVNIKDKSLKEEISRLTGKKGVFAAFDAIGNSFSVNECIDNVKKGGSVVLIGNAVPKVDFPLQKVVANEISLFGSNNSSDEFPECLSLMTGGKVDVSLVLSKVAPLSEGGQWFGRLYNKEKGLIKVVLIP